MAQIDPDCKGKYESEEHTKAGIERYRGRMTGQQLLYAVATLPAAAG